MEKPTTYAIPRTAEIRSHRLESGLVVASTFAGCGGSSLGYEWAGMEVRWANEVDPHAALCHRENFPECRLSAQDIRKVLIEDVLADLELRAGQLDVLDGSPPCQGFSTSGNQQVGDPRNLMFWQFIRLLDGLQPRAFIAENVPGMWKGRTHGLFCEVMALLKSKGYVVECRELDAQWLGVPQRRRRLIFIGIREDMGIAPAFPKPLPWRWSVSESCPWIRSTQTNRSFRTIQSPGSLPSPTLLTNDARSDVIAAGHPPIDDPEESAPDLADSVADRESARVPPGGQSDRYFNLFRAHPDEPSPCVMAGGGNRGTAGPIHPFEQRKMSILELRRLCGFPDDFALPGPRARRWKVLGNAVPPPMMREIALTLRKEIFHK